MTRAYTDYLRDMLDAIEKAERFLSAVTEEQFKANDEKVFAVVRALEIVGEAARCTRRHSCPLPGGALARSRWDA